LSDRPAGCTHSLAATREGRNLGLPPRSASLLVAASLIKRANMAQDSESGGFLAYYENAHRDPLNRWMHHAAHSLALIGIVILFYKPWLGVILALLAFPISWTGHYVFEANTPAFFEPPSRRTVGASAAKKIQVALGGVVWSAVCLWRACQRALHTRDAAPTERDRE